MKNQFSRNLKYLRNLYNLTYNQLSEEIKISKTKLWKLEHETVESVQFLDVYKIAEYFTTDPISLFFDRLECTEEMQCMYSIALVHPEAASKWKKNYNKPTYRVKVNQSFNARLGKLIKNLKTEGHSIELIKNNEALIRINKNIYKDKNINFSEFIQQMLVSN